MPDNLMTSSQVSAWLGVTSAALAQMRYQRRGPDFIRISGQRVRYRREDVEQWISRRLIHQDEDVDG